MDPRTQERVTRWNSHPFTDGFTELATLADDSFSGVIEVSGTWLSMLNGRIVGIIDGDIDTFEDASGTVYTAPTPALPLLCVMLESNGDTRASYYTNETPLEDVDNTLQNSSFTGYVELSEQVLSGDYYLVYYGGKRMAAAYIGNAERLLTGKEAFSRAADEVGIYEVIDVDVSVTDIPEPSEPTTAANDVERETNQSLSEENSSDPRRAESTPSSELATEKSNETTTDRTNGSETPGQSSTRDPPDRSKTGNETVERPSSTIDPKDDDVTKPGAVPDSQTATAADVDDHSIDVSNDEESVTEDQFDTETETDGDDSDVVDWNPESETEKPSKSTDSTGMAESIESNTEGESSVEPERNGDSLTESPTDSTQSAESVDFSYDDTAEPASNDDTDGQLAPSKSSQTNARTTKSTGDSPGKREIEDTPKNATDLSETTTSTPSEETTVDHANREQQFEREEQWRETRQIPSIDPENTTESSSGIDNKTRQSERQTDRSEPSTDTTSFSTEANGIPRPSSVDDSGPSQRGGTDQSKRRNESARADISAGTPPSERESQQSDTQPSDTNATTKENTDAKSKPNADASETDRENNGGTDSPSIDRIDDRIQSLEAEKSSLEAKVDRLHSERDAFEAEKRELEQTVEALETKIDTLTENLEQATGSGLSDTPDDNTAQQATNRIKPDAALTQTNLFVRYGSKSDPTLEAAQSTDVEKDVVEANLQLEPHTVFDATDVTVDGQSYEEFLGTTMEYHFVEWLVGTLLFEIRDTGKADALGDLYAAIPNIDRTEFSATISLAEDDTEDVPDSVTFDVVAFDKMGTPLIVATLNDSRDPASREMLEELEATASAVNANYPDLAGAFAVTASFFEPGALELTERATSGGFLSRSAQLSYVNLSRKQGYHLCLVESRAGGFHVTVPEL